MVQIRQVTSDEAALLPHLSDLLKDAVDSGASVGFLRPLAPATAVVYWQTVLASLGEGLALWVAESEGRVVGSVQLALSQKENGRHRAEVQKLFVQRGFRGQGISRQLMTAVEAFARANGRTLLVLDTEAGSPAEAIYRHLGWQKVGEIPNYALTPDGRLHATAYYYKAIG